MRRTARTSLLLLAPLLSLCLHALAADQAVLRGFTWRESGSAIVFRADFTEDVRPKAYDLLGSPEKYFYVDFYGVAGPSQEGQWDFGRDDLLAVRRTYYAGTKTLRLIFHAKNAGSMKVDFSGSGRVFEFRVWGASARLGQKPAAGKGAKKLVVIDPGHGGKSQGAATSKKINGKPHYEKDIVLDIARRMAPLFKASPNIDFVLTRTDDRYVSLEDRIKIADEARADLFVSIHLNASGNGGHNGNGFEIYYLSDGTKETNRQLEHLENDEGIDVDTKISGGADLRALLKDLADDVFDRRREESHEFCHVVNDMFSRAGPFKGRSRGVKNAAFRVLMNYNMPAVLAECGFIDHPGDAALLVKPEVQDEIASLLFNAVNLYFAAKDPQFQAYLAPIPN